MEKIDKNNDLIQNEHILNDRSALPLKNNNNQPGSIITTLMSTHLVKKPQNDNLFKSERPENDADIESIETKLSELKNINDPFARENIISNRDFTIPEKKITDEVTILTQEKIDKEKRKEEYEKELKTDMELYKKNMEKDEKKIESYYKGRRRRDKGNNLVLIILIIIIFSLLIVLLILLLNK